MEKSAYPILKDHESFPNLEEKATIQNTPVQYVIHQDNNLEFKFHWEQIFNVIMIIGTAVYFGSYTQYFVKHMDGYFTIFVGIIDTLIVLSTVWHFNQNSDVLNSVLLHLSYSTFILFFGSVLAVVITIPLEQDQLFTAIIAAIFVNLPGSLLGWSTWLVVKEHIRDEQPTQYSTIPQEFDQEAVKMTKVAAPQQIRYVPVVMGENGTQQIFQTLSQ
mmetsp:Transcript_7028/g.6220  ORF Transcript_7028/g.6220 Transcript_7028/m.6220 type:complete len:217 (+) Transcript_7028:19-669(+)